MKLEIETICNRKAVIVYAGNERILFSYDTRIATINAKGELIRNCEEWALSNTTMRHLHQFAGDITKKDFLKLELKEAE